MTSQERFRRFVKFVRGVVTVVMALAAFVAVGWWLAPEAVKRPGTSADERAVDSRPGVVWTCSMHPQIRQPSPGRCPICGMDLVPTVVGTDTSGVTLTHEGRRIARVETTEARRAPAVLTLRTVGRFALDETLVYRVSAYLTGRIEAVHIPLEGNRIEAGAPLVDLLSAELASLHAELKASAQLGDTVKGAVMERLRRAGLTDAQIADLEKQANPIQRTTLMTPASGIVTERAVKPGAYVKEGDLYAAIATFDRLVLDVDVFEKDLTLVTVGAKARVEVGALGDLPFEGTVASVKPFLDTETRTAQVRIYVDNAGGRARPGMYARVAFEVPLGADGRPLSTAQVPSSAPSPAPLTAQYACPMRCVPNASSPGKCPKCGMTLKLLTEEELTSERLPLLVPATALLDLGQRELVYVETRELHYEPREVKAGPRVGKDVVILTGLAAGEKVVSRGAFLVDSQTQIEGRESLILTGAGHAHAGESRPGTGEHR